MCHLEVCIDSVDGARTAQDAGAARVELCCDLVEGGITPSYGLIRQTRRVLESTQLMVLIRPRGGDFIYTADELQVMLADIAVCKELGADGVVIGCLQPDGQVDMVANSQLVQAATQHGLDVTFHRAFDVCRDLSQALEDIISLKVPRVLTSGGCPSALGGAEAIAALVKQAAGRISVMAGGGVRANNAAEILAKTGVMELHSAASRHHCSTMQFRRADMHLSSQRPPSDFEWNVTDDAEVKKLVEQVHQHRRQQ